MLSRSAMSNSSLPGYSVYGIFPGKNAGVGHHFLFQGNLPDPGIEPVTLASPALAGGFFITSATWEAQWRRETLNMADSIE